VCVNECFVDKKKKEKQMK